MDDERYRRNWWRQTRAPVRPTGRTTTIWRLIDKSIRETGLPPSDAELARTLACSPERVAHHRRLLRI